MAKEEVHNPFGDILKLEGERAGEGRSYTELAVREELFNPNGVLHGGVIFSLADTCMGRALYSLLEPREGCATIEIKMNFLRPVKEGRLVCNTQVMHRGRTTAVLDSTVTLGEKLVAKAQGTYAIFELPPG